MKEKKATPRFSPSDYMRARRPELFSDSKITAEPQLTRELLDYHLDTLTRRKQEIAFEYFARRLAEKEICPNLLPQTGPTGGGDSKVDTETYPVAEMISALWYEGIGQEAAQERWAFAFSAKKDWLGKVRADVKKIITTDRDYKLIFFVTNQFVADRSRAKVEEELTKRYGIPLRVFDRSWIVDRVFTNNRIQIAIESLNLTQVSRTTRALTGPRDVERNAELTELDREIGDTARYKGAQYQLAEDCLRSALLARGLERPRDEIEGRFERAKRIAEKVRNTQQQLRVAYLHAWTELWWYEDFSALNRLYQEAESYAKNSDNAADFERLLTLWQLLAGAVSQGHLDIKGAELDARVRRLKTALGRIAKVGSRPNNALQARTSLLQISLVEAMRTRDKAKIEDILKKYKSLLNEANTLGAFPFESLANLIRELGTILTDSSAYDDLFELVVSKLEKRKSEGEGGRAILERAAQKLRAKQKYDAIRLYGRAQEKLTKHEYRDELVQALVGCGLAYESAGLLWAARTNILAAANQAFAEFFEEGKISRPALLCLQKLGWLELQIGRPPCVLGWLKVADAIASQTLLSDAEKQEFQEARNLQDIILGLLFLIMPLSELKMLHFFPDVLEKIGFTLSSIALLYALGYEDELRREEAIPADETTQSVEEFFSKWINQPARSDLPKKPGMFEGNRYVLRSHVLGCEIIGTTDSELSCIHLLETILGALEAFFATSMDDILPHQEKIRINVQQTDSSENLPKFQIDGESAETVVEIAVPKALSIESIEGSEAFHNWLMQLVAEIMVRYFTVRDSKVLLKRLGKEERAFSRAVTFAHVSTIVRNILGNQPKLRLLDWQKEVDHRSFPLKRSEPWHSVEIEHKLPREAPLFADEEPPSNFPIYEQLKHSQRRTRSVIDIPMWDKARWRGTGYLVAGALEVPPILILAFKDEIAAKAIFRGWHQRFGIVDTREEIRVAIVTGIDRANPATYKVHIGTNLTADEMTNPDEYLIMVSRYNMMIPQNSRNLDNFLARFKRIKKYGLIPGIQKADGSLDYFVDLAIEKTELHVRPAWQIGPNDPDMIVIKSNDKPIIPKGEKAAPVKRTLSRIRKLRKKR